MFQPTSYPHAVTNELTSYWAKRAEGYNQVSNDELQSNKQQIWLNFILGLAPQRETLKVLDIGCGPGFFAVTLAMAKHQVTAVDATPAMLEQARNNAQLHHVDIEFVESDVHQLPFADNQFDLIVTRNVTWNLANPAKAYQEWYRVLANEGRLLNFDANWYLRLYEPQRVAGYEQDRLNVQKAGVEDQYLHTDTVTMENIARQLPLSRELRPHWDFAVLVDCGFRRIHIDLSAAEALWDDTEKLNNASTPMFLIAAEK